MALDRYLAVCHGLSNLSRRIRSRRPCYIITAIAWIVAILMCIPVMMYADTVGDDPYCVCSIVFPRNKHQWCEGYYNGDEYDVEKCITETYEEHIGNENCEIEDDEDNSSGSGGGFSDYLSDYTDAVDTKPCKHHEEYMGHEAFILFNFIVMFIIPLITISVCYTLIIVRLRRTDARSRRNSERNESSHSSETTRASTFIAKSRRRKSSSGGGKKQKTKVTIMCVVLVLLFATCWMPYNVVQTVKLKGIENVTEAYCSGLDTITIIFLYLNSALNPYLYNFLGTFGKRIGQIRKHRRTKTLMSTFKLNRVGRKSNSFVSSSETAKTKKSSIPNEKFRVEYLPKEEEPLTIENVYEDKPTSSGTQL
nr:uncharacterized protein LOC120346616 isoform X2 [Styela clava]